MQSLPALPKGTNYSSWQACAASFISEYAGVLQLATLESRFISFQSMVVNKNLHTQSENVLPTIEEIQRAGTPSRNAIAAKLTAAKVRTRPPATRVTAQSSSEL